MKRIVLIALITVLPVFAFAAATSMNLSDALKKAIVKMDAVNTTGNYKGKAIKLTITNNSGNTIEIKVDLGMILKPDNPAFQPLVLAGEEVLTVKAHQKGEVDVAVFCDNATKACPIAGLHYTFLRVGGDTLLRILQFIHGHSLFDQLGQAAVWAITDYHPLNNVYDRNRDSLSRKFISFIADVTKREKPTFYTVVTDNETPAQPAYIPKIDRIYVPFDLTLRASSVLTIGIFNSKGLWVKSIFERKLFEPGKHNLITELDPTEFDPGKYSIRLMDPEKTLQEKEITVGVYQ